MMRRRRFQSLSLGRMIPSILTVGALSAGLTSIRFALEGQWGPAIAAILVAAVLDGLDGRMARLLRATTPFGAQLDSLSDAVAFGVAPALVIYLWALHGVGNLAWAAALFLAICTVLRLARFNTAVDAERPPYAHNYFTGVPSPAGGVLALLPLVISLELGDGLFREPLLVGAWLVFVGGLMVSTVPTFALRRQRVPSRWVLPLLAAVGLVVAGLAERPFATIAICSLLYLASFPLTFRNHRQQRMEYEARAAETAADLADTDGKTVPLRRR